MKKELGEFTGKTVKEATEEAAKALGLPEENLIVEVLEEGKKGGLFGIGAVDAKIKVFEEVSQSDGERAVEFLKGLLDILDIRAEVSLVKEEEKIEILLKAEKSHDVIGKRGATLDAIQSLVGAIANIGRNSYKRVVVDCENYRERREETLRHVAQKTAEKAVRQGRKISLEPMSAYERRIIHAALAESTEVKTSSEGKEPRRHVVVIPNEMKPYNRDKGGKRDRREGRREDRRGGKREGGFDRKPRRQYTEEEKAQRSQVGGGTGYKKNSFYFGAFLGNSRDMEQQPAEQTETESEE